MEMNGLEAYAHGASPYYILNAAHYADAALAYRLSDRFAVAVQYDRFDWNWAESGFVIVDPVGNTYGTWGPGSEDVIQQYTVAVAGRIVGGLSAGLSGTWMHVGFPLDVDAPVASFSLTEVVKGKSSGLWRPSFRFAGALRNLTSSRLVEEGDAPYGSWKLDERIPVTGRLGGSATLGFHSGVLADSLRTAALTAHVQYDDDVNSRYRSAVRLGAELELLQIVFLRVGWYKQDVYDYELPQYNKDVLSAVTYGFGLNIPVRELTKGKIPVSISVDYTRLPQVSYSQDDLSPFTDDEWDDFESFSLRINYGMGRLVKPRTKA